MTIEKTIARVTELYNKAINDKRIRNPVAWALYETWRTADEQDPLVRVRPYEEWSDKKKANYRAVTGKERPGR